MDAILEAVQVATADWTQESKDAIIAAYAAGGTEAADIKVEMEKKMQCPVKVAEVFHGFLKPARSGGRNSGGFICLYVPRGDDDDDNTTYNLALCFLGSFLREYLRVNLRRKSDGPPTFLSEYSPPSFKECKKNAAAYLTERSVVSPLFADTTEGNGTNNSLANPAPGKKLF